MHVCGGRRDVLKSAGLCFLVIAFGGPGCWGYMTAFWGIVLRNNTVLPNNGKNHNRITARTINIAVSPVREKLLYSADVIKKFVQTPLATYLEWGIR